MAPFVNEPCVWWFKQIRREAQWDFKLTSIAPILKRPYVASWSISLLYLCILLASYNGILNIIPKRHSDSITLSHSPLQQSPCQIIALSVKTFIRQACSLVARDDSGIPIRQVPVVIAPGAHAVRSPYWETIEEKCSPTVCSSNGGYSV